MKKLTRTILLLVGVAMICSAQRYRRPETVDRGGVPEWEVDKEFMKDIFTFVRIQYDSTGYRSGWGGAGDWTTDYPDADLNLAFRLQQLTSLKVNPNLKTLRLTEKDLFNYPFIYIVEPGELLFSEAEVKVLRRYLFSGGFLMVDDFWGEAEWMNLYQQMKRVQSFIACSTSKKSRRFLMCALAPTVNIPGSRGKDPMRKNPITALSMMKRAASW
jgi:hypothetical protein